MINININKLNEIELSVHNKLSKMIPTNANIKILEAANYCEVSPSKVSKLVRKLGFESFKQYKQFFSGQQMPIENKKISSEIDRLKNFLENFDSVLIDNFLDLFNKYDRIVFFGLGPSFICIEYFAYKLTLVSGKNISVAQSESYAQHLADEETLFVIFSVTGKFTSFENLINGVKARGANILMILEEYNTSLALEIDNIFYLTNSTQDESLLPFEKTRTVFFIFIEEVIARLMSEKDENNLEKI
ncbi:MurR/RpiR family transcriptional regulator [Gottfriedia acidiceleris]|uniref:MurR/RpiR family transcriptional regulator n=1 Tax=Gottfriedia acidiceleris TaxID=371036 RepID=UPI0014313ED0|nr:SIS domain-containing protein [Gottfriedia acidiceleris]